jgi:hypothetical protein
MGTVDRWSFLAPWRCLSFHGHDALRNFALQLEVHKLLKWENSQEIDEKIEYIPTSNFDDITSLPSQYRKRRPDSIHSS